MHTVHCTVTWVRNSFFWLKKKNTKKHKKKTNKKKTQKKIDKKRRETILTNFNTTTQQKNWWLCNAYYAVSQGVEKGLVIQQMFLHLLWTQDHSLCLAHGYHQPQGGMTSVLIFISNTHPSLMFLSIYACIITMQSVVFIISQNIS